MYRKSNYKPRHEQTIKERNAQRAYERKYRKAFGKSPNKYNKHRSYNQSKSKDIEENLPNLPSIENSDVNYVDSIEHFKQEKTIDKLRKKYKIHKGHEDPATDFQKKLPAYEYYGNNALNKTKRKEYDRLAYKNGLPLLIDRQESTLRAHMEGNSTVQTFRGPTYLSEQDLYMSRDKVTALRKDDRKNSRRLGKKFDTRKKLRRKLLAEREQQAKQIRQQRREQSAQLKALNRLKRSENRDDIKELLKMHEETKALEKRVKNELKQDVTKEDLTAHKETEEMIKYLKERNNELRIHPLDNERGAEEVNDEVEILSNSIQDIYELEQEKQEHLQQMLDGEKAQVKAEKEKFNNLKNDLADKLKGIREMVAYKKSLKEQIKQIDEENTNLRDFDHKKRVDDFHDKSTNAMAGDATIQQFIDEVLVEQEFDDAYNADDELSPNASKDDDAAITRQENLIADKDFMSANPQIEDNHDIMIERSDNLMADKDFAATTTNVITTLSDDEQLEKFDNAIKDIKPLNGNEMSDELKQRNKALKSLDNKLTQFAKRQEIICDRLAKELDQKKSDRDVLKDHQKKMDDRFSKLTSRVTKKRDAQQLRSVTRECDSKRRRLLHKFANKKGIINDANFINKVMARPPIKSSGNFLQRWKNFSNYLDTANDTTDRYNSEKDGLKRIEKYIKHKKKFGRHHLRKLRRAISHSSFFDSTGGDNTIDTDAMKASDKKHNTYEEPKYYWAKTFKAKLEKQLKERLGVDHDNTNDLIDMKTDPKSYRQAVADAYDASLKDPKMVARLKDYGCTEKEFGQILVDGKESYQLVQDMGIPQLADLKPSQGNDNINDDQQDISHSFSSFGY